MRKYVLNLMLIVIWIIAGVLVMCSEEISKFSYVAVLICYVLTLLGDAIEDYCTNKKPPRLS